MQIRRILCTACIVLFCAGQAQATPIFDTVIDGRVGPQYAGPGSREAQIYRRPWSATEKDLVLENILIHDVTNQKGIDINATRNKNAPAWAYRNVTVRNYEGYNINRDETTAPGLHIDFLRIAGGGDNQDVPTTVLLENIYVHDGDALPLIIQDGIFDTITLRNIRIEDTYRGSVQITTRNSGSIDRIIIEDCPGLRVNLMHRLGSIDQVDVINSPGITLITDPNPPQINYLQTRPIPIPEPGLVALTPAAALLVRRRR